MANWLMDYIELTEYVPSEFRNQSFIMRELDLKVSMTMNEIENDIKDFFANVETMDAQVRQDQFNVLLKKCNDASQTASDKVAMAEHLYNLVEKSLRVLDQGLDKLKEDLLEGGKAYVVEDIERRVFEQDEQMRLEREAKHTQQRHRIRDLKSSSSSSSQSNNKTNAHSTTCNHTNHRTPVSATQQHHQQNSISHYRGSNNSTGSLAINSNNKQFKRRERKRLSSGMTIFNSNSKANNDDSKSQSGLLLPATPDHLVGLKNNDFIRSSTSGGGGIVNTTTNISTPVHTESGGDMSLEAMIASGRASANGNNGDKTKARQPILTAIDAAHAVSPNANSDKLGIYSNDRNGDKQQNTIYTQSKYELQNNLTSQIPINLQQHEQQSNRGANVIGDQRLGAQPEVKSGTNVTFSSTSSINSNNRSNLAISESRDGQDRARVMSLGGSGAASCQFVGPLPLSSRHDPIMMAASQAISATQNMTHGRRTSSLKASYAAVNSGRLQTTTAAPSSTLALSSNGSLDQVSMPLNEVYCKCRGAIQDPMMIACDNKNCKYEWFHWQCVGITTPPEGEWFCDDCLIMRRAQHGRSVGAQTQR